MDQHPIPQDVTGFQFKLIGSMTVKQFGYVAAGVISAVILHYAMPGLGVMFLFKYVIIIPIVGGSGFIIAFLPIEGRPIDVMATNFVKAFLAPNQYVYRKVAKPYSFSLVVLKPIQQTTSVQNQTSSASTSQNPTMSNKGRQLQELLLRSQAEPKNALDKKEQAFLDRFSHQYISTPAVTTPTVHTITHDNLPPAPKPLQPTQAPIQTAPESPKSLDQKEEVLEKQLEEAKHTESEAHAPTELSTAHQKVMDLEKQIREIHIQKQMLETELSQMKTQLAQQKQATIQIAPAAPAQQTIPIQQTLPATQPAPALQTAPLATPNVVPPKPAPTTPPSPTTSPNVRNIPQDKASSAGSPRVSDTPNVIIGIVKDPRGNVLSHILIEVKDAAGNPVRAFKTNVLGQFASATPLANGIYTIELEDPKKQQTFDKIQITTEGRIMLPIEVISHDAREELRRQLFN